VWQISLGCAQNYRRQDDGTALVVRAGWQNLADVPAWRLPRDKPHQAFATKEITMADEKTKPAEVKNEVLPSKTLNPEDLSESDMEKVSGGWIIDYDAPQK
jgi:hypothetical protein